MGLGHPESDPHGAPDPEGERVGDDLGPGLAGLLTGLVDRAVVDHQDGGVGNGRLHLLHHQGHGALLVEGGEDHDDLRAESGIGFASSYEVRAGSSRRSPGDGSATGAGSSDSGGSAWRPRAQGRPEAVEGDGGHQDQGHLERGPVSRLAEGEGHREHHVEPDGPEREGRDPAPAQDDGAADGQREEGVVHPEPDERPMVRARLDERVELDLLQGVEEAEGTADLGQRHGQQPVLVAAARS